MGEMTEKQILDEINTSLNEPMGSSDVEQGRPSDSTTQTEPKKEVPKMSKEDMDRFALDASTLAVSVYFRMLNFVGERVTKSKWDSYVPDGCMEHALADWLIWKDWNMNPNLILALAIISSSGAHIAKNMQKVKEEREIAKNMQKIQEERNIAENMRKQEEKYEKPDEFVIMEKIKPDEIVTNY
jgi:hypothetical protein